MFQQSRHVPSTRRWRRAINRYGETVLNGTAPSKHRRKDAGRNNRRLRKTPHRDMAAYNGMIKIRDFCLRAGVLVLPFEEHEMKALLTEARDSFMETGLIPTDVQSHLVAAGVDVEEATRLWGLMSTAEVDMEALEESADESINSFQ